MKNLFGFQTTKKVAGYRFANEYAGEEFIVRRVDPPLAAKQAELFEQAKKIQRGAEFPQWLNTVVGVIMLLGIGVCAAALSAWAEGDAPYETMVHNGLWYFVGSGGGVALLCGIYYLIRSRRRRNVMSSPDVADFMERSEKLKKESLENLLVPETAVGVDIFIAPAKAKFEKTVSLFGSACLNENFHVFRDGDALCIADETCVMRIPFEKIVRIVRVMRGISFCGWNKPEGIRKGKYAPYKIRTNEQGILLVNPFYVAEIAGAEPYALAFPPYEYDVLAPLLGSKAFSVEEVKKLNG